jgi:hypothetical protein
MFCGAAYSKQKLPENKRNGQFFKKLSGSIEFIEGIVS